MRHLSPIAAALALMSNCTTAPLKPPVEIAEAPVFGEAGPRGRDNAPMAFVPEGAFVRGSTPEQARAAFELCERFTPEMCQEDWFASEQPQRKITLDAFWIDVFEVTNAQYRRCAREGACPPLDLARCQIWDAAAGDWRPFTPPEVRTDYGAPDQPAVCVSWGEAETYCRWAGKQLPTEAQWEKAARGTDGRTFPWGEQIPTCAMAHMTSVDAGGEGCGVAATAQVGRRTVAPSPYGAFDMSGNVVEWTRDFDGDGFYAASSDKNPVNTAPSDRRVIRGGAWNNEPTFLRAANRGGFPHDFRTAYAGFRCAMTP